MPEAFMKADQKAVPNKVRTNQPLLDNLRFARQLLGNPLPTRMAKSLKTLSQDFNFSLSNDEIRLINRCWYVTHTGLLRLASRKRCRGIQVEAVDSLCDSAASRFVLKATVYPSKVHPVLSVTATPTPRTSPSLSTAPKCASPRPAR